MANKEFYTKVQGKKIEKENASLNDKILHDISLGKEEIGLPLDFYKAILSHESKFSIMDDNSQKIEIEISAIKLWALMAFYILGGNKDNYWDAENKKWLEGYGPSGHYFDLVDCLSSLSPKYKKGTFSSTGLNLTTSLAQVENKAGELIAKLIGRKVKGHNFVNACPVRPLHDMKEEQDVVYTIVANRDQYEHTPQFGYTVCGLAFYNFKARVISPELIEYDKEETQTIQEADGSTYIYPTINKSKRPAVSTATLTTSNSVSASNSFTNTKSTKFGQMVGVDFNIGSGNFAKVSIGLQLSFEETLSTAYTETETVENNEESTKSIEAEIPPHTVMRILQNKNEVNDVIRYGCPVLLEFDVAMFSMCGTFYDDNVAVQSFSTAGYSQRSFCTFFNNGKDKISNCANDNLYVRKGHAIDSGDSDLNYAVTEAYTKRSNKSPECKRDYINWKEVKDNEQKWSKDLTLNNVVEILTTYYPASSIGAVMSIFSTRMTSEVENPMPIYPIKHLAALEHEIRMKVGDRICMKDLSVSAYDEDETLFYGFSYENGKWQISEPTQEESCVEFEEGSGTTESHLIAKCVGQCNLIYVIDDNVYSYYDPNAEIVRNIKAIKENLIKVTVVDDI